MRILVGPGGTSTNAAVHAELPDSEHEFFTFGHGGAEIAWDPGVDDFESILRRLPVGWRPELVIFCSPEYHPIPRGIEKAKCPTAAVIGDWNLGGQAFQLSGSMFDILASDQNGCDRLREAGFRNVVYVPFFTYDPAVLRQIDGVERDLDIVMAGNFHGEIQRDRAPWVARVASLSDRYRIELTSGVFGQEYARLMNRAKIVFNRSIRGEINMRAYEAAACGALMFCERENREIREVFTDKLDCVLYSDDDLEELLEFYLRHDAERARIAEAGRRTVQLHTPAYKSVDMVRRIADSLGSLERFRLGEREFCRLPDPEQRFRRAYQWVLGADYRVLPSAVQEIEGAAELSPQDARVAGVHGCALYESAIHANSGPDRDRFVHQALAHLRRAVVLDPRFVVHHINIAVILRLAGALDGARAHLDEAVRLLKSDELAPAHLLGPSVSPRFTGQGVDTEWEWAHNAPLSPGWMSGMRRILLWRAMETLCNMAFDEANLAAAHNFAAETVHLAPDRSQPRADYARALRSLGLADAAVSEYRAAIRLAPLDVPIRLRLSRLLLEMDRAAEAEEGLRDAARLIDGSPYLAFHRDEVTNLIAECRRPKDLHQSSTVLQLLAFPDWNNDDWKRIISFYAREFGPSDPISLRLRVEPGRDPGLDTLVPAILLFAQDELGIRPEQLPDLTLAAEPLGVEDRWKLFGPANILVSRSDSAENVYAEARGIPIVPPERLPVARVMLAHPDLRRSESTPCLSI